MTALERNAWLLFTSQGLCETLVRLPHQTCDIFLFQMIADPQRNDECCVSFVSSSKGREQLLPHVPSDHVILFANVHWSPAKQFVVFAKKGWVVHICTNTSAGDIMNIYEYIHSLQRHYMRQSNADIAPVEYEQLVENPSKIFDKLIESHRAWWNPRESYRIRQNCRES